MLIRGSKQTAQKGGKMKRSFLAVFITVFITGFIWAQEKIPEEAEFIPETQPEVGIAKVSAPGTITFNFKDADIRNVMRLIAIKAGVNIVYGPEVTGVVNMELHDVPWEQALHLVLDLNGYAYQKKGNVIKVLKKEDVAKSP